MSSGNRALRIAASVLLFLTASSLLPAAEIPGAVPEEVGMSSPRLKRIDGALNQLVTQNQMAGGIVLVARRGRIVHFESYGLADIASQRPMGKDAILRFYSMSKAVTSAAAMILVDEGKLDLHAPVAKYLPELNRLKVTTANGLTTPARALTTIDLLRHTSGMTYGDSTAALSNLAYHRASPLDPTSSLKDMCQRLADVPLAFHPGDNWAYGISIDVVGRIVEVISGENLDDFLDRRLFQPLDMEDTGFFVPPEKHHRYATTYVFDGRGVLRPADTAGAADFTRPRALLSGGGGLVSTARDYLRFLMMIQQNGLFEGRQILSRESVRLMTTSQLPVNIPQIAFGSLVRTGVKFGLGFSVRTKMSQWDPQGRVGEYGWGGLASTHCWCSPQDELIVMALEQTFPFSFRTEFAIKGIIYDAIRN